MSKTMAEVLAQHRSVDVPLYPDYYCCSCGNISAEQPSVHRAEALSAAGFGLVAEARAQALEDAADELRGWWEFRASEFVNPNETDTERGVRNGTLDGIGASVWKLRARADAERCGADACD